MIFRIVTLACLFAFATSFGATNVAINTDAPDPGFANNRKNKTYKANPTDAPAILLLRGDVSRVRGIEFRINKANGCLYFSEETLLEYGAAKLENGSVKLDAMLVIYSANAWLIDAQGKAHQAGHWEFNNPDHEKNTKASFTITLWDDDASQAHVNKLSLSRESALLSKDERETLNRGKCPFGLFQRIRAISPASSASPAAPISATEPAKTPLERLKQIYDSEGAKIDTAAAELSRAAAAKATGELAALRAGLVRAENLEGAVAVKALEADPDSAELRAKATDEAKPVLSRYDTLKSAFESDRNARRDILKQKYTDALTTEMKAAMKRGDLDGALAVKKTIADLTAPPVETKVEPAPAVPPTPAPAVTAPAEKAPDKPASPPEPEKKSDPKDTPFGRRA